MAKYIFLTYDLIITCNLKTCTGLALTYDSLIEATEPTEVDCFNSNLKRSVSLSSKTTTGIFEVPI